MFKIQYNTAKKRKILFKPMCQVLNKCTLYSFYDFDLFVIAFFTFFYFMTLNLKM